MIRAGKIEDVPFVENTYNELMDYEQLHGTTTNWDKGVYPTAQTAEKAVREKTLYVLEENEKICASMIFNRLQPEDYSLVEWEYDDTPGGAYVIHTLCIPPSGAKKGYGTKMVQFAVSNAKENGASVIRLDTWENNLPAAALYKKLGFR